MTCRLPVFGTAGKGFVDYPNGAYHPQPEVDFTKDETSRLVSSVQLPVLRGNGYGFYYDRAYDRWLPVDRSAVAGDGRHYAYSDPAFSRRSLAPRLHVVSVQDGSERVFQLSDQPWGVVMFGGDGIYLRACYEGCGKDVLKVDPSVGTTRTVGLDDLPIEGAGGHRWDAVVNPADSNPQKSALSGENLPNQIVSVDRGQAVTRWFYRPGFWVFVHPFLEGTRLLVIATSQDLVANTSSEEAWLVTAPGVAERLALPPYIPRPPHIFRTIADSHGLWFGSGPALVLLRPSGEFVRVTELAAEPGNGCA